MKDGGLEKGKPKAGIRDTTVFTEDYGEHRKKNEDGSFPMGMVGEDNIQFGHYPPKDGIARRYDDVGPRFDLPANTLFKIKVPDTWVEGQELSFAIPGRKGLAKYPFTPPSGTEVGAELEVDINAEGREWWRGIRKGKAQLLWETGSIDPKLTKTGAKWINDWASGYTPTETEVVEKTRADGKKNASAYLAGRRDFQEEKTVIEKLFIDDGHLVLASPRYHPELAGLGIEYCWGKSKWCFRRQANDLKPENLTTNVLTSLGDQPFLRRGKQCDAPLPLCRVRKFARRARLYCELFHAYPSKHHADKALEDWSAGKKLSMRDSEGKVHELGPPKKDKACYYKMIERMYTLVKTHCNIIDYDTRACLEQ
jgi:hypothetical protein